MSHHPRVRVAGVIAIAALAAPIGCALEQPTSTDPRFLATPGNGASATLGQEKQCAGATVIPSAATISVGETLQLAGIAHDKHGKTLDKATVAWSSLGSTAAVSASGLVTGLAAGTDTIVARCSPSSVPGLSLITVH